MNADLQYGFLDTTTKISIHLDHLITSWSSGQVTCVGGRNLPALPRRHLWVTCGEDHAVDLVVTVGDTFRRSNFERVKNMVIFFGAHTFFYPAGSVNRSVQCQREVWSTEETGNKNYDESTITHDESGESEETEIKLEKRCWIGVRGVWFKTWLVW